MSSKPLAPVPADCSADEGDFHPLEVFAFFRRYKRSHLRDLIYTFIWNCSIGLIFWVGRAVFGIKGAADWGNLFWSMVIANAIGYTIHGLFFLGSRWGFERRVRRRGGIPAVLYYTGVSTFGVLIGFAAVMLAIDRNAVLWLMQPRWITIMGTSSLLVSVILAFVFFVRERQARTEAALERERLRVERIEREAALANLRALQAQIEPHFLFNTLANVVSLVDPDPAKAKAMLESFIQFLRASLAATRMESTTLGAEAQLVAAYLHVLQVRMGDRLRYTIDIADDLRCAPIAPMLLQPVVENSIRHGLEPKVAGGAVVFRARRDGADIVIEISDTGVGFAPTTRGGVGLSNLRERLKLLYGDRASLAISEGAPAGATVTIRLPS